MKCANLCSVLTACGLVLAPAACGDDDPGLTPGPDAPEGEVDAMPPPDGMPACEPPADATVVMPSADDYDTIQAALIEAAAGDVIYFCPGTYTVTRGLSLAVENVTLRGAGSDRTILSFAGQTDGAQGLLVTADGFTIEDLAVEDTAGDAIKVEGATGVTFRGVRVEWTGEVTEENGAYGLYPVQCTNVLIEDSTVRGASDAGIYVGQSTNIIVRNNTATENVAGIEIENSFDADVHGNTAMGNTGGILIFNLPGLQVENGARTRVFDNVIAENNHENFAPEGNIVGQVPKGTGIAMIAAHEVEIFGNEIADNQTVNLAVVSYSITLEMPNDETYEAESDTIYIHDNTFTGGGNDPSDTLGALLEGAMGTIDMEDPVEIPDIIWDGVIDEEDPTKIDTDGTLTPEFEICIQESADVDFGNIDWPDIAEVSQDLSPHDCTHDPLPEVVLP